MYSTVFKVLKIIVMHDAKTGSRLNHNWDVVIDESIGRKLAFLFILICSQNTDKGYITFAKVIKDENKYPFFE